MKTYLIILIIAIACVFNSCSKGGDNNATPTTPTKPVTPPPVVVNNNPEYILQLTSSNQTNLDASGNITSAGYTIVNFNNNTTSAINLGIGGKIRVELKNIASGSLNYEGDDYTKVYYPKNVFKTGDSAPKISDTSSFACVKITDPSAKDASTGQPLIRFLFLDNIDVAGAGGLGLVSDAKLSVMKGSELSKLYTRPDYKMNN